MNRFQSILAFACAALSFSCSAPAFAQFGPPDTPAQTWQKLNVIQTDMQAIHADAIDALSVGTKNPDRVAHDQSDYYNRREDISNYLFNFGYSEIGASVGLIPNNGITSLGFNGTLEWNPIPTYGSMCMTVLQTAKPAHLTFQVQLPCDGNGGYSLAAPITQSAAIRINNQKINITTSDVYQMVLNKIANRSGVDDLIITNSLPDANGIITFTVQHHTPGSQFGITLQDPTGFLNGPLTTTVTGEDAIAVLSLTQIGQPLAIPQNGFLFGGSQTGDSGLTLRDEDGTVLVLQNAANILVNNLTIGDEFY